MVNQGQPQVNQRLISTAQLKSSQPQSTTTKTTTAHTGMVEAELVVKVRDIQTRTLGVRFHLQEVSLKQCSPSIGQRAGTTMKTRSFS